MRRSGLFTVIALALGAVAVVPMAYAQQTDASWSDNATDGGWYIVPRIGGVVGDNSRHVKTDPLVGLGMGTWLTPNITLDAELTNDNAGFKHNFMHQGRPWQTFGIDVAGRYYFLSPSSRWRPYLMLGVGSWRSSPVVGHQTWSPGVTGGVGVLYNINDRIALRGEIADRYYRDKRATAQLGFLSRPHSHYSDQMVDIGLVVNLGRRETPPPPPAAPPPPPPPPAAPPPPPPQNVVIDLRGVNFKFDRPKKGEHNIGPTLKPPASDSLAILNQAVDTLNRYPQVKVEIDGYTDSVGTPKYNLGLSDRRAHIVADYLTSHGIDPSRITNIQGFGEADPIDTNKTAAGRQRNRRVEFKVEQPNQGGSM